MIASTHELLITALLTILSITILIFSGLQYHSYNPKATKWNLLNLFSAFIMLLTAGSLIPQYFLLGRTAHECCLLHHFAGTITIVTVVLTKVFFLARSSQVLSSGRALNRLDLILYSLLLFHICYCIVFFNLNVKTAVVPPQNLCLVELDTDMFAALGVLVPKVLECVINVRFISHIFVTTQTASKATGGNHSRAPRRLIIVTCAISAISMIVSLTLLLWITETLRIPDRSLMTPLIAFWQVFEVCATAWPTIIIRVLKMVSAEADPNPATRRRTLTRVHDVLVNAFVVSHSTAIS